MSGIICSQGGHLIAGQMAKAFSSAKTPRHLRVPGILTSLRKGSAIQESPTSNILEGRAEWQAQLRLHSS